MFRFLLVLAVLWVSPGLAFGQEADPSPAVEITESEPETADDSTVTAAVPVQATDDEVARSPDASAPASNTGGDARAAGEVGYDIEGRRAHGVGRLTAPGALRVGCMQSLRAQLADEARRAQQPLLNAAQ